MTDTQSKFEEKQIQALNRCNHLTKDFADRADRHKNRYKRLQFFSISLAIATTVLSALSATKKIDSIQWVVTLVSGLATLSTTLLTQTNSQKMWVQSRNISQKFQTEEFLYKQCSKEYEDIKDEEERLQFFSKQIMDIWSQAQENWSQSASSTK